MAELIENKVAKSGLITLNLEELKPNWEIAGFDLASVLFEGLLLREKDFREFAAGHSWSDYKGRHLRVYCSTDAIVPTWAYMLIATKVSGIVASCSFGTLEELQTKLWRAFIQDLDTATYSDQRVIIKGCSNEAISETIYMELTAKLTPVVKTLMFGEPCSTVPLFKRK